MKALLLFLGSFPVLAAVDGDKIGNGGGLWACINPSQEIQSSMLVDFYEAQNQYGLTLISSTRSQPMEIVNDIEQSLRVKLPEYTARWSTLLTDVSSRIQPAHGELVLIEDSLYIVRPYPALCRFGWQYVQFANYTNYNAVLIRDDLWNSPMVSALDKAGLIWHEVIYRWMREEFGDKNSVRARRITGLLFSTKSMEESRSLMREILNGQGPKPSEPVFVCLIENRLKHRFYFDYGPSELEARRNTLKSCQNAGEGFHCDNGGLRCESFMGGERQKFTCAVTNRLHQTVFTETGRSRLEAEAKVRKSCEAAGSEFHCVDNVECSN